MFFNKKIESFRVTFGYEQFNNESIESEYLYKGRINERADGFRKINHLSEHKLNKGGKFLPEPSEKRGVRDFRETTKIFNFLQRERKTIKRKSIGIEKIFSFVCV